LYDIAPTIYRINLYSNSISPMASGSRRVTE